jgi:hypothetical protein
MPELFFGYMKKNFNMVDFRNEYETLIINKSIKNFISNTHYHTLHPIVISMLKDYRSITNRIKIHKNFPKDILVSIFKPYLHLYYIGLYATNGTYKQCTAVYKLRKKLRSFVNFNPMFGRKYISVKKDMNNRITREHYFNQVYLHFYKEVEPIANHDFPIVELEIDEEQSDDNISDYYDTEDE